MFYFGQFCDAYLPVIDGVVMVVKHYADILNSQYGMCTVVTPKVPKYKDAEDFKVIRTNSVPLPKRPPYRVSVPELHKKSLDEIALCRFDLIHTHSPFGLGQYGLKVAKKRDIPVISTFHSKYYDDFKQVFKLDSAAKLGVSYIVNYYNNMDQVWTVGKSTEETLREYGYKGNVEIIANGSDTVYPDNAFEIRAEARRKYNIPDDMPTFLFIGQQVWQKNIKMIVESMEYLKKTGFRYKMVMTGKGYAEEDIRELVVQKGLSENFIFTGQISDRTELTALYLMADIFIFPSLYDNTPLVIKEAAGLKTPSLVIEGANAAEGITDGVNGFLVKNDCEDIGNRLINIYKSGVDLDEVGANAMKTIPVPWENILEDVYGRYVELIKYKNKVSF